MKKFLSIIMAAAMLTAFAGCEKKNDVDSTQENDTNKVVSSDLEYIKKNGEMVVGITLFAPMNYMDGNELVGFETEFAKAVCEKLGVKANFQEINWDSKEIELNAKNIDCIWNGMTIDDDRKASMSISMPYMENKQVMVVKSANADKYASNVDGAEIVAEAGSAGETLATEDEFFKSAKFTSVDSQAKALMDVASGTSDIAIVDYVTSIGSIGEGTDFSDLVVVEAKEFSPEEYGVAFRKGSDVTEKVNEAMKELAKSGELQKIAEKYKLEDLVIVK